MKRTTLATCAAALLALPAAAAAQADLEIAKQGQIEVARIGAVNLRSDVDLGLGVKDRTRSVTVLAGNIPIATDRYDMVLRLELPLIWQPVDFARTGGTYGLGDFVGRLYFTPAGQGRVEVGGGPVIRLPTATDSTIGSHKWSAGLAAGVGWAPGPWVAALGASYLWTLLGPTRRVDLRQLELRPVLSYHFASGYYLVSAPVITFDTKAPVEDRWLVPVGGGLGKVWSFGGTRVTLQLEGYAPAKHPRNVSSPDFTVRAQAGLLFPVR